MGDSEKNLENLLPQHLLCSELLPHLIPGTGMEAAGSVCDVLGRICVRREL